MAVSFQNTDAGEQYPSKAAKEKTGEYCLGQKVKSHVWYHIGWWTRKGASPPQPSFPRVITKGNRRRMPLKQLTDPAQNLKVLRAKERTKDKGQPKEPF